MNINDIIRSIEISEQSFLIVICATVVLVVILVGALFYKSRNQLNWYEQNVLEMGQSPMRVHCTTNSEDTPLDKKRRFWDNYLESQPVVAPPQQERDLTNLFMIPKAKRGSRGMFSNLHHNEFDRGLYQFPMGDESACSSVTMRSTGSIQLSVTHDVNLNLLTVSVKQALELPSKREDDEPNIFMKLLLEIPDAKKTQVEHQTKVYRGTSSPQLNEDFYFPVTSQQVAGCKLEVMVFDYDQFSVDECIGFCWVTLGRINSNFEHDVSTVFWIEVLPYDDGQNSGFGEVNFSLSYLSHAQRLSMNIFKLRNMRIRTDGNIALRITILTASEKQLKKKKTNSKKFSRTVHFNECLTFTLPKNSLCDVVLCVELIGETGTFGIASRTYARMQLPLHKCKDLWRAIIREEKSQARWYAFEEV